MPLQTIALMKCQMIPSHYLLYCSYLSYKMKEAIMKFWIPGTCPRLISCIMILRFKYTLVQKRQMSELPFLTRYYLFLTCLTRYYNEGKKRNDNRNRSINDYR